MPACARLTLAEEEAKWGQLPFTPSENDAGATDGGAHGDGDHVAMQGDGDSMPADAGAPPDAGSVTNPRLDSGTPQPGPDASQPPPPPVDAGTKDPNDKTPDPNNSSQCPSTAPPLFQLSPCVAITLKCHYGSTYTCTCYAAGWTCFN